MQRDRIVGRLDSEKGGCVAWNDPYDLAVMLLPQ